MQTTATVSHLGPLRVRLQPHCLWRFVHAALAVLALVLLDKQLFHSGHVDGFSYDMKFMDQASSAVLFEHPLYFVQMLRYVAVYLPWLWQDYAWGSLLNGVFITALMWPIVSVPLRPGVPASRWRVLLFFLPCAISLRGVMVTVGMGYLFLLIVAFKPSRLMYVISALCVNLSSASVLLWLVLSAVFLRRILVMGRLSLVIMAIMAAGLTASIMHKTGFFYEEAVKSIESKEEEDALAAPVCDWLRAVSGIDSAAAIEGAPLWLQTAFTAATILDHSTIVVSLANGHPVRGVGYIGLLLLYLSVLVISMRETELDRVTRVLILAGLPMFLTEGLGVLALLSPIWLFVLEREKPKAEENPFEF